MADEPRGHIGGRLHVNQGDGPAAGDTEASAHRDASGQDMCGGRAPRRDFIYAKPVDVRLADGRRGTVRHPPFDGRVQVVPPADRKRRGCAIDVPLDDLAERSRITLAKAEVRRRVEVRVRCSRRSCTRTIFGWLTEKNTVETTDGQPICSLAGLFSGKCPKHRTRG